MFGSSFAFLLDDDEACVLDLPVFPVDFLVLVLVIGTSVDGLVVGVPFLSGDGLLGRVFGLTGDGLIGCALGFPGDRVFLSRLTGDRVLGLAGDLFLISCLRFATRSSYFSVLCSNLEIDLDILLFLDIDLESS